ncbi:uncharacterized protein LY79DRAFT_572028 [Colletotrichum navitas]|uniref:Uncharacterized protein n=1 Tax=Colletotrichum navitas TaxID=681940 RepID=A0AAD8PKR3_9PEZI|nr:uncharacterized protein LY79DRAFT_572028 [Colletotrichum navitas]KAK1569391.1 hypothetical protein LY79DRAFT_572028 [Colletotrichum navitas]
MLGIFAQVAVFCFPSLDIGGNWGMSSTYTYWQPLSLIAARGTRQQNPSPDLPGLLSSWQFLPCCGSANHLPGAVYFRMWCVRGGT